MTYILRNYVVADAKKDDKIIKDNKVTDFEQYVLETINKYKDTKDKDLFIEFLIRIKLNQKIGIVV